MENNYLIQNGDFFLQGFNGWGARDEATPMTRPNALKKCVWLVKSGVPNAKAVPLGDAVAHPRTYPSRKRSHTS